MDSKAGIRKISESQNNNKNLMKTKTQHLPKSKQKLEEASEKKRPESSILKNLLKKSVLF